MANHWSSTVSRKALAITGETMEPCGLPNSSYTTPRAPQELLQPRPIRRRQRLYPLAVTLKMFLTQCLSDDPSCRTAVATAKERGWVPQVASPDTGAYCRARDHLSPSGLAALVERTGSTLENVCQPEQWWRV